MNIIKEKSTTASSRKKKKSKNKENDSDYALDGRMSEQDSVEL